MKVLSVFGNGKDSKTFQDSTRMAEVVLEDTGRYLAKLYIDHKEVQWLRFNVQEEAEAVCEDFVYEDGNMDSQVLLNG